MVKIITYLIIIFALYLIILTYFKKCITTNNLMNSAANIATIDFSPFFNFVLLHKHE